MNLSEPFIRRPVMTTLVMICILVFGIISYKKLPVNNMPNVDYPTISVSVGYPGANPETMANTCATPLEKEFMTIEGLDSIASTSNTGSTNLVLQFNLEKNIDDASIDVQAAINRATPNLPQDLPYNPIYRKVNPAATPILYFALTSPSMDLADLYDYGNKFIGQRLSMIEGVSQVQTFGAAYAARIQIDPEKLAAMQVGLDEISEAIQKGTVDFPTGILYGKKNEFTVDVAGQLFKAEGYNDLVIKTKDGALVKISQIGRALNSLSNDKFYLNYTKKDFSAESVILAIQRQPGVNTVQIIKDIKKILPTIQKTLPASLELHHLYDQSEVIQESVDDVTLTLIIALILVIIVIYLSLGKILNTVIPSLALPLSIVGTFAIMLLLDFSLDILSLLALTLSIGFLVDDAIVVLENNVRHVQLGESPFEGTIKGSKEISVTIISMTICLIAVFIPMLFLGGLVGRLFREFAITIVTAVAISGIISLSLTPLLSSRFIPPYKKGKKGRIENFCDTCNEKLKNIYKKLLNIVMKHRLSTICVGIFCIIISVFLYIVLPKDFLPPQDIGFIQGFTRAQDGTSPFQMAKYQKK